MRYGIALRQVCETCGQPLPDEAGVMLQVGQLVVNPVQGTAHFDGQLLPLTPIERRLLTLLAANPGDLCTYADLYEVAWSDPISDDPDVARRQKHALRVHLARLKARLGPVGRRYMVTAWGPVEEGGIKLVEPPGSGLADPAPGVPEAVGGE